MKTTAIICVLKTGGLYKICDVIRLQEMIKEHVTMPYEFACLTDAPTAVNVVFKSIPLRHNWKGYWSKIELFRPNLISAERIVYFDLDTLILRNIDDIILQDAPFIALRPFNPKRAQRQNYFASAIMAWDNDGRFNYLYDAFKGAGESRFEMSRHHGDQDYLSHCMNIVRPFGGRGAVQHLYWQDLVTGIYSYKRHYLTGEIGDDARIICFHGFPRMNRVDLKNLKSEYCENIGG